MFIYELCYIENMSPAWRTHLQLHLCDRQLRRSLCFLIDRLEVAAASSFQASSRAHSTRLLHRGVSWRPDSNFMCEIHQYSGVAVLNGDVFCHICVHCRLPVHLIYSIITLPQSLSTVQFSGVWPAANHCLTHHSRKSSLWNLLTELSEDYYGQNVAVEMFRRHFSKLWALKTKLH